MAEIDDSDGLWVRSDVMPDGTYGVAINVGADRSWPLNRDRAVAYAVACVTRATEAEHDAAVFAAFKATGMDDRTAGMFVVQGIRPDRPDDHSATEPLRFVGALGLKVGPFIKMELDGQPCGEMTTADLIDHAMGVLKTLAAADLDAALLRTLRGPVGLNEERARAVVGSLAQHWPTSEVRRG